MDQNEKGEMKALVLDLDNTLINTEKIKQYFDKMAFAHDLNQEQAKKIYQATRDYKGHVIFDIVIHYQSLREAVEANNREFKEEIYQEILNEMYNDKSILLEGVKDLLENAAKKQFRIIIISLGVDDWQEAKIEFSGLADIIREIEEKYGVRVEKKFTNEEQACHPELVSGSHEILKRVQDDRQSVSVQNSRDMAQDDKYKQNGKVKAIRQLFGEEFNGEGVTLFNDKPEETAKILRAFPVLHAFVRQAVEDSRYNDESLQYLLREFRGRVQVSPELTELKKLFELKIYETNGEISDNR